MPQSVIVAASSIRDFFQEAVRSALDQQTFCPNTATSSYLVDLLCEHTRAQADLQEALALTLAEAQRALPSQSIHQLKQVGDQSLYVAGFFSECLRRSQLNTDYYVVLGGSAYRRLSGVLHRLGGDTTLVVVFSELGDEFARFVQLLSDVRTLTGPGAADTEGIGNLYEQWLRTGSTSAARKLREAGFVVLKRPQASK